MSSLVEAGIMHLWDGALYVGSKKKYTTIEEFVENAVAEYDILYDAGFEKEEVVNMICRYVITGFMAHRACPCPEDEAWDGDWWEYYHVPARGRSPVWCFDLDKLRDPASGKFPYKVRVMK